MRFPSKILLCCVDARSSLCTPVAYSGRSTNLHLGFDGSGLLKSERADEAFTHRKRSNRLQKHHVIFTRVEHHRGVRRYRNRRNRAHGGSAFAVIDDVLFREIGDRTSRTQQRIGRVDFISYRQIQRNIDANFVGGLYPTIGNTKLLASSAGNLSQAHEANSRQIERRFPPERPRDPLKSANNTKSVGK